LKDSEKKVGKKRGRKERGRATFVVPKLPEAREMI